MNEIIKLMWMMFHHIFFVFSMDAIFSIFTEKAAAMSERKSEQMDLGIVVDLLLTTHIRTCWVYIHSSMVTIEYANENIIRLLRHRNEKTRIRKKMSKQQHSALQIRSPTVNKIRGDVILLMSNFLSSFSFKRMKIGWKKIEKTENSNQNERKKE